jgi:hypothetical protein
VGEQLKHKNDIFLIGMNGWIQALKKQSGPEKRRKNSCTWLS